MEGDVAGGPILAVLLVAGIRAEEGPVRVTWTEVGADQVGWRQVVGRVLNRIHI